MSAYNYQLLYRLIVLLRRSTQLDLDVVLGDAKQFQLWLDEQGYESAELQDRLRSDLKAVLQQDHLNF